MCHHCVFGMRLLEAVLGFPLKRLPRWGPLTPRALAMSAAWAPPRDWRQAWSCQSSHRLLGPLGAHLSPPLTRAPRLWICTSFPKGLMIPPKCFHLKGFDECYVSTTGGLSTRTTVPPERKAMLEITSPCLLENALCFVRTPALVFTAQASVNGGPLELVRISWITYMYTSIQYLLRPPVARCIICFMSFVFVCHKLLLPWLAGNSSKMSRSTTIICTLNVFL